MRRILLAILLIGLGLADPVFGNDRPLGDTPWPWGTECPFPWENIEGMWSLSLSNGQPTDSYLNVRILTQLEDGLKIVGVSQYNRFGVLVAHGRGLAPHGRRIVRASMQSATDLAASYWAIIRSYNRDPRSAAASCTNSSTVKVVTLRAMDAKQCLPDQHYLMVRVNSN